jgi:Fic family protein
MATPEFRANYRRYTAIASGLLMRISTALGTIGGARILPAAADQLRASARAGTVHFSNLIEGNELPYVEAERAARGELAADTRAKIELVNYVNALDLIDERLIAGRMELTSTFLRELHGTATRGLGRVADPHFKPHHEGAWRDGAAVVVDHLTGQIMHRAPPPADVPGLTDEVFSWLAARLDSGSEPPFVLAGVLHYAVADVHPFADGNGRVARLVQTALLMKTGVLPGRMFSFESYYAKDTAAYHDALRSVRRSTLNMEAWLEYFLLGLADEYERVAAVVADLSSLVSPAGRGPLRLTATQERAIAALRIAGRSEFTRRDYEQVAGVERTAATDDLRDLILHRVVATRGAGPATRYAFSAGARPGTPGKRRGRPPAWDDSRIERELRSFLATSTSWPSPAAFAEAGRADLYSAASRAGGIDRWRAVLEL